MFLILFTFFRLLFTHARNFSRYLWLQIDHVFLPLPSVGLIMYPLGSHSFKSFLPSCFMPKLCPNSWAMTKTVSKLLPSLTVHDASWVHIPDTGASPMTLLVTFPSWDFDCKSKPVSNKAWSQRSDWSWTEFSWVCHCKVKNGNMNLDMEMKLMKKTKYALYKSFWEDFECLRFRDIPSCHPSLVQSSWFQNWLCVPRSHHQKEFCKDM